MYTIIVNTPGPQGSQGPQGPSGSQGQSADTGSLVTTSLFNSFTSSYYVDSASFNSRINNITFDTSSLATTGSNTFIGNQTITGSVDITGSLTVNDINVGQNSINFINNTNTILTTLSVDNNGNLLLSTGSIILSQGASLTGSIFGTASWANNFNETDPIFVSKSGSFITTSSFNNFTSSYNTGSFTGSFIGSLQGTASWAGVAITSSHALSIPNNLNLSASNLFVTNNIEAASITSQSASFGYVESITGSAVYIGQEFIILNTQPPAARYAGLIIIDSGSANHTSSLLWDSSTNHFIYQNASGSSYSGGGFISGPRNTGSLEDITYPTLNKIVRGQGGDHIYDSNITDNDTKVSISINTDITGSLIVTSGITGSLFGTSSWAINALTASYIDGGFY